MNPVPHTGKRGRHMRTKTIALGILLGVALGVGSYTFIYARGYSYLSNNPKACTNCHVMKEYYSAWQKGSHHAFAKCNDCHTPPGRLAKYATKTRNGFVHSLAFTGGRFPDAIQIGSRNHAVTEQACRYCHQDMVSAVEGTHREAAEMSCIRCHASTGHSEAVASTNTSLEGNLP